MSRIWCIFKLMNLRKFTHVSCGITVLIGVHQIVATCYAHTSLMYEHRQLHKLLDAKLSHRSKKLLKERLKTTNNAVII
jgi:hypothetical protein